MLVEDMRLLGQRQRMLLLMAQQGAWTSCSQHFPGTRGPLGVVWSSPGGHRMAGKPWTFKDCPGTDLLKEPPFFEVLSSKPAQCLSATLLPRGRLFSEAVGYKNVLHKAVLKKPPLPLSIRCAEMPGTNGNGFLTTFSYLKSVPLQINAYAYLIETRLALPRLRKWVRNIYN